MPEYIEKEKLKEALCPYSDTNYAQDMETILRIVDELPAADVAPVVHGRWEPCFEDWRKEIDGDRCSACGFEHYGNCISNYNYCPNCGANMDLE